MPFAGNDRAKFKTGVLLSVMQMLQSETKPLVHTFLPIIVTRGKHSSEHIIRRN